MSCRYGKPMIVLAALALLPGCSALIGGPTQDIALSTNPPGAQCRLTRENAVIAVVPQTPAMVRVNRSPADIVVDCRRDGHADARHQMKSSVDGMVFGNIVGAGLMGFGIDSATGADRKYDSAVTLTLLPQSGPAAGTEPRQLAQASPATAGDVSQASWIAQRTASSNASNQVPTAPVGYVPPPPPPLPAEKPTELKPAVAAMPMAKPPAQAAPSKAAAAMKDMPSAGTGLWRAHLASHRTEGAAINEWQELLKKDPKLYGNFDPKIEWIDVKDRGSFARLMLGGWPERKGADAACAKIRGPQRYCAAVRE